MQEQENLLNNNIVKIWFDRRELSWVYNLLVDMHRPCLGIMQEIYNTFSYLSIIDICSKKKKQ